jgi:excisionase family DNA binding protein
MERGSAPLQPNEQHAQAEAGRTLLKPITVTVAKTCHLTSLGNTKIYELIKEGRLKSVAVGRRRLVFVSSIDAFLNGSGG